MDPAIVKKFSDAYYGENAVIGDGELLKKIIELFAGLIGGCPFGARQAHRMLNGGSLQQNRAKRKIWFRAYDETGDADMADKIVDAGMKVGTAATEAEFVAFVA